MASIHLPPQARAEAVLIAGPTASGKTALALALARRHGGTIINADSMQVYRDLRILTARPTDAEEAMAPHRLFGTIDAADGFSVAHWLRAAAAALAAARDAGHLPIFVGGTGLYFKALTQGLSAVPDVPPDVRARVRAVAMGVEPAALHAALAARDPQTAAGLRPSDPQRVLRALEVLEATGRGLASYQGEREAPPLAAPYLAIFLAPDRAALRARIDARFEAMLRAGAIDEVAALASRGLSSALPAMRAHGVPALIRHIRGEIPLAAAAEAGQRDTRAYARRQFTFVRHQLPAFAAVAPDDAADWLRARL